MPTKFRELAKLLKDDGWELDRVTGSHHMYKHPTKVGTVSVPFHGNNVDVAPGTLRSILKQARLEK